MTRQEFNQIANILEPLCQTTAARSALLFRAFPDNPQIIPQIDVEKETSVFLPRMIRTLHAHLLTNSETALWRLLETARQEVGFKQQKQIDALKEAANTPPTPFVWQSLSPLKFAVMTAVALTVVALLIIVVVQGTGNTVGNVSTVSKPAPANNDGNGGALIATPETSACTDLLAYKDDPPLLRRELRNSPFAWANQLEQKYPNHPKDDKALIAALEKQCTPKQ